MAPGRSPTTTVQAAWAGDFTTRGLLVLAGIRVLSEPLEIGATRLPFNQNGAVPLSRREHHIGGIFDALALFLILNRVHLDREDEGTARPDGHRVRREVDFPARRNDLRDAHRVGVQAVPSRTLCHGILSCLTARPSSGPIAQPTLENALLAYVAGIHDLEE